MRVRLALFFVASGACSALAITLSCLPGLTVDGGVGPPVGACGSGVVDLDDGEACDPGDAGAVGCSSSCQVVCEGGVIDDATSHCYYWTPPVNAIDTAVASCGSSAHPVSFVDLAELTFVAEGTKNLPFAATGASWLALEKTGELNDAGFWTYYAPNLPLPGWAASCIGCYGFTDASDFDLPSNGTPQTCVEWRSALTRNWEQTGCTLGVNDAGVQNLNTVLCEREPPGAFSSPCTDEASAGNICIEVPVTHATKRYELAGTPENFTRAQTLCASLGGSLVHFLSGAEREEVVAEVVRSAPGDASFWIGLTFDSDAGAWTWVDGTPALDVFPTPWADLEPSMSTGAAAIQIDNTSFSTRLARAEDALTPLPYICEFAR